MLNEIDHELLKAIKNKSSIKTKFYLDNGADANAAYLDDKEGAIPALILAVREGHIECIAELLKWGADPDAQIETGSTVLSECLRYASSKCVVEIIPMLISANVDLNKFVMDSDENFISPLLRVAYTMQLMDVDQKQRNELLLTMIENGADIFCVNEYGDSLFDILEKYPRETGEYYYDKKLMWLIESCDFVKSYIDQKKLEKEIKNDDNEYSFQF